MNDSPFLSPLTFLNLPLSQNFVRSKVAILGIPFDCGRDPTRFGARLGPNAIRQASILTAELLSDAQPSLLDPGDIIDAGNVRVALDDIAQTFELIEQAMRVILDANCLPITLGGDGAVSLPQMRALAQQHGKVALLHFDAHTDTWPLRDNNHYNNANQFTHAVIEELLDLTHAIHIGTRGPVNADKNIEYARSLGYEVIPFDQMRIWGEDRLLAYLRERVSGHKIYLCFDMDFFDPSVAPGVATPTPGGAMPIEGLSLLRGLKDLDIVAVDINTTTPLHDTTGATATLAASVLAECLALITYSRVMSSGV